MSGIKTGDKIPSFSLPDQDSNIVHIDDLIGKSKLVIFFYPKDNTIGCIREACGFRDHMEAFRNLDATIIGISSDSPGSHKKFASRYDLNFTLLSDNNAKIRKLFGVKSNLFGIIDGRATYIINKKGVVVDILNSQWSPVKHIKQALSVLRQ